jgi:hypothetical protein
VLHKEGCVILNPINGGTTSTTTELYKYYFDSILIVTLITIIADKDSLRVLVTSEEMKIYMLRKCHCLHMCPPPLHVHRTSELTPSNLRNLFIFFLQISGLILFQKLSFVVLEIHLTIHPFLSIRNLTHPHSYSRMLSFCS